MSGNSEKVCIYIASNVHTRYGTVSFCTEIESNNALVKVQVFQLLSALSVYSQEGHALALDALEHHKVTPSHTCPSYTLYMYETGFFLFVTEALWASASVQQAVARVALQQNSRILSINSGLHKLPHCCI